MKTFYPISSLDVTIVVTDKQPKHENDCQKSVRLTNKRKLDTIGRVDKVHDSILRLAQIERKKENKRNFFNKHKNK